MKRTQARNIDEYIQGFPTPVQKLLQEVRVTIQKAAPQAEEGIKYGLPTFLLNGNLVHFGAFKNHIGFYPTPSGIESFKQELSKYNGAKGSIQFPLNRPLPLTLISKMVKFRVRKNLEKTKAKAKKK